MRWIALLLALACLLAGAPLRAQNSEPTPAEARAQAAKRLTELRTQIGQLIQKGEILEANETFKRALEANPQDRQLGMLRRSIAYYLDKDKHHEAASEHASVMLEEALEQVARFDAAATSVTSALKLLLDYRANAKQHEQASQRLEAVQAKLRELAQAKPDSTYLAQADGELAAMSALWLHQLGKAQEAEAKLQELLAGARAEAAKPESSLATVMRLVGLLEQQSQHATSQGDEKQLAATMAEVSKLLRSQADEHGSDRAFFSQLSRACMREIGVLARSAPDAADEAIQEFTKTLDALEQHESLKQTIQSTRRSLASYQQRLESVRAQLALIGKPALPIEPDAWANGGPLTADDLKGKVVLVDFWAVWCGPCIATFPHLRQWREEFGPKGFEVVGVTRYYQYGWDAEAGRPKREAGLSSEDELKAMAEFAKHHELKHPFAVMGAGSEFHKQYGVTGIPQAVLIDRQGNVQMIKVGSGEANAKALEAKIRELLGEPATGA